MKIALVHEYLAQAGGAERVLESLHEIWPEAPIFVWFYDKKKFNGEFDKADIRTSFIQKLPGGRNLYHWYLPLMPMATERHRLDDYDVVISSSSSFGKGIITGIDTLHISYCHTPTRYLWTDTHDYLKELPYSGFVKKAFIIPLLHRLRVFDRMSADRVDNFIANSETVKKRINKFYRRDAHVIYPPVDIKKFYPVQSKNDLGDYFLAGGRLAPVKKFDLIIQTFRRLKKFKLKIFGTGPQEQKLKKMAGRNIEFAGYVSDSEKAKLMRHALGFIHPQLEDFGITAIEAMASGRPVIAYGYGGACETVIPGKTGALFFEQNWETLLDAVINFDPSLYDAAEIRKYAENFSKERFQSAIKTLAEGLWHDFNSGFKQEQLIKL